MWSEFVLRSNFSADLVEARECKCFCWRRHLHPFNGFVHYKLPTFPHWTSYFLMQQRRMENDTKMTLEFGRRLPRRVREGGNEGHEFDVGWNWKNGCMVKMGLNTWSDSQEVDHLVLVIVMVVNMKILIFINNLLLIWDDWNFHLKTPKFQGIGGFVAEACMVRGCAALSDSSWQTMANNREKVAQICALHVPGRHDSFSPKLLRQRMDFNL